ncbi:protein FAR1-RELATED SEQUENCE 5-like [Salvia splendens]|uniref:protein FAR1-RELATED SEQUENCE 5-like n=1 Tax=Salvia splendens TaxID=180675 RepID=UPI001C251EB2|nr:protein FAR1-RELATED SEQUENCE 5-like [Salvia splendens]
MKRGEVPTTYLLLYVDDMLVAGAFKHEIQMVKVDMRLSLEIQDLDDAELQANFHTIGSASQTHSGVEAKNLGRKGAGEYGIQYKGDALRGFCDCDFVGNLDNRRLQSGYVFTMYGSAVSWKSSLQSVVALSTTDTKFMDLAAAVREFMVKRDSKQGSKNFIPGDASKSTEVSVKKRRCRSFRCECLAKLNLRYFSDGMSKGYEVYQFVEYHNHLMVADEHRHFMTANRSLDPTHRRFMEDCGRCNIGPTLTFKLLKELMGGPENVGYAQMIFDYMRSQKESSDAFYYEIEIGSHRKLTKLFWADAISRRNYHMFGDVISFDSTYNTDRYCMIFAPFTGKDNHSRAVTFGAGLLSSECRDSYTWHRWYMWHIMVKVSDKLPKSLLGNEDFKKELNACVWSDLLELDEFDIIWNDLMERYGLEDVHWFGSMFEDREFWVPAYFRDFPMGSLLRTTSMSESENSFFKNYTKPHANLVQFINFFNCAVGDQRNANSRLNYLDYSTISDLSTQLLSEKHASTIYTDSIFKHVQQEISMVCEIVSITVEDNIKMYKVKDQYDLDEKQEVKKKFFSNFYRLVQKSEGNVVRTKGSTSDKVSNRESAIRKANKPLRRCGKNIGDVVAAADDDILIGR